MITKIERALKYISKHLPNKEKRSRRFLDLATGLGDLVRVSSDNLDESAASINVSLINPKPAPSNVRRSSRTTSQSTRKKSKYVEDSDEDSDEYDEEDEDDEEDDYISDSEKVVGDLETIMEVDED